MWKENREKMQKEKYTQIKSQKADGKKKEMEKERELWERERGIQRGWGKREKLVKYKEASVTRFGQILPLEQTFKSIRQTFQGLFSFEPTLAKKL